jgi:hypothetical protein
MVSSPRFIRPWLRGPGQSSQYDVSILATPITQVPAWQLHHILSYHATGNHLTIRARLRLESADC